MSVMISVIVTSAYFFNKYSSCKMIVRYVFYLNSEYDEMNVDRWCVGGSERV